MSKTSSSVSFYVALGFVFVLGVCVVLYANAPILMSFPFPWILPSNASASESSSDVSTAAVVSRSLSESLLRADTSFLSSSALEGRGVGTRGEDTTVSYVASRFLAAGLTPAFTAAGHPSFFQNVPLVGQIARPSSMSLGFSSSSLPPTAEPLHLEWITDFVAESDLYDEQITLANLPLCFVGYGINAPERGWNDYAGLDVSGCVVVAFVNDPFDGETLTYYGRWTYKQEEARRQRALGIILIHTEASAGYPFQVLVNGAVGEQLQLDRGSEPPAGSLLQIKAWITASQAAALAELCGSSLGQWEATRDRQGGVAASQQLEAVTISGNMSFTARHLMGKNVGGLMPSRSGDTSECTLISAHHDHLGMVGTSIFHGALDNAVGVGLVLNMLQAFASSSLKPAGCVAFATWTAEEAGLLGAEYFVSHRQSNHFKIKSLFNIDGANIWGRTYDIVGLGGEFSEMGDIWQKAAEKQGLTVSGDLLPGQGSFFRSDQLPFYRVGIPCIYLETGHKFVGQPESFATDVENAYISEHYHKPSDVYSDSWDLNGAIQQMKVIVEAVFLTLGQSSISVHSRQMNIAG